MLPRLDFTDHPCTPADAHNEQKSSEQRSSTANSAAARPRNNTDVYRRGLARLSAPKRDPGADPSVGLEHDADGEPWYIGVAVALKRVHDGGLFLESGDRDALRTERRLVPDVGRAVCGGRVVPGAHAHCHEAFDVSASV